MIVTKTEHSALLESIGGVPLDEGVAGGLPRLLEEMRELLPQPRVSLAELASGRVVDREESGSRIARHEKQLVVDNYC